MDRMRSKPLERPRCLSLSRARVRTRARALDRSPDRPFMCTHARARNPTPTQTLRDLKKWGCSNVRKGK